MATPILNPNAVALVGGQVDAFGRIRVSNPETLFDSKQCFDNQPLFWDDLEVSGSGTSSTYTLERASSTLAVSASTAGRRIRQTYRRFNYQPGKSQQIDMTFVADTGTGITQHIGLGDNFNGIFLFCDEGSMSFRVRSNVTASVVNTDIPQSSWNIDKLDGTGASGVTLDPDKAQIFSFDFEWLGVGSIRFGFVVDGVFLLAHIQNHTNVIDSVYMSTPNLPLRYEIENDGTGGAASLEHICSTVVSEGGQNPSGFPFSFRQGTTDIDCNSTGTTYAIIGARLKAAYIGAEIEFEGATVITDTNDYFYIGVYLNPTVAGTFTYSSAGADSALEVALGDTGGNPSTTTVTGGTLLFSEIVTAQGRIGKTSINEAFRLGADYNEVVDEVVVTVTPITSGVDAFGTLNWREIT